MKQFETGDVVQLKSGGPKMTVEDPDVGMDNDRIYCQWFAGSKLEKGHFQKASVIKIVDDAKPQK